MARPKDREKAIELRLQGKSYSEIKRKLGLNKSTLSGWLTSYPLSQEQAEKIKNDRPRWIENFRNTMAKKRSKLNELAYDEEKKFWLPLTPREVLLAGTFLYWGEGTKAGSSHVVISNTNPKVIQFSLYWLKHSLNIDQSKIYVRLHLYSDMNIQQETDYWAKLLNLPKENFKAPYIKKSQRNGLTYKSFGHGTCNLLYLNVRIKRKIMKSIEAIGDEYSKLPAP